ASADLETAVERLDPRADERGTFRIDARRPERRHREGVAPLEPREQHGAIGVAGRDDACVRDAEIAAQRRRVARARLLEQRAVTKIEALDLAAAMTVRAVRVKIGAGTGAERRAGIVRRRERRQYVHIADRRNEEADRVERFELMSGAPGARIGERPIQLCRLGAEHRPGLVAMTRETFAARREYPLGVVDLDALAARDEPRVRSFGIPLVAIAAPFASRSEERR